MGFKIIRLVGFIIVNARENDFNTYSNQGDIQYGFEDIIQVVFT